MRNEVSRADGAKLPREPSLNEDLERLDAYFGEIYAFNMALGWAIDSHPQMCTELSEHIYSRVRDARADIEKTMKRHLGNATPEALSPESQKLLGVTEAASEYYAATSQITGTDEQIARGLEQRNQAQYLLRQAPCQTLHDLLIKLRVFEDACFEDGGEFTDGRELAWLGALKADVLALRSSHKRTK
ncbi:MAG: hypothetical protein AAFX52_12295 [Pseudomonadota bacterium]